jgi:hypothetical protein
MIHYKVAHFKVNPKFTMTNTELVTHYSIVLEVYNGTLHFA